MIFRWSLCHLIYEIQNWLKKTENIVMTSCHLSLVPFQILDYTNSIPLHNIFTFNNLPTKYGIEFRIINAPLYPRWSIIDFNNEIFSLLEMDYRTDSINGRRKLSGKTAIRSSLKVHSLEMNCLLWLRFGIEKPIIFRNGVRTSSHNSTCYRINDCWIVIIDFKWYVLISLQIIVT